MWFNSTGGPLILAETVVARHWKRIVGNSSGLPDTATDYSRACQVTEYLVTIDCNSGEVLVLGDEPLQSAIFEGVRSEPFVARWIYANSPFEVGLFSNGDSFVEIAPKTRFRVSTGELLLFDSSENLEGVQHSGKTHRFPIGSYDVTTEEIRIEGQCHFLLHRFLKFRAE